MSCIIHCSETVSVYAIEGERPGFTPTQESEKVSEVNN